LSSHIDVIWLIQFDGPNKVEARVICAAGYKGVNIEDVIGLLANIEVLAQTH